MPNTVKILNKPLLITKEAARFAIIRANYYAGNYQNAVWLIGDGRSGTTYVSSLLNWNHKYREMFEPFHPIYVKQMKDLPFHKYIRPDDVNNALAGIASDVFTGKLTSSFIDISNRRLVYKNLLIKDIFANLLANWAYHTFSHLDIKVILLLRNPFAVALSKYKKKHWHWMTDPKAFLDQQQLMDDHLRPFKELIKNIGDDYIERQILIWSIINYVPLRQFNRDQLHVLFYEDIIAQPGKELASLFNYINPTMDSSAIDHALQKLHIPSWVSGSESNIRKGKSPIDSWQKEITPEQLQNGRAILERFGFSQLYKENGLPERSALNSVSHTRNK
jgi:hypothetical protein